MMHSIVIEKSKKPFSTKIDTEYLTKRKEEEKKILAEQKKEESKKKKNTLGFNRQESNTKSGSGAIIALHRESKELPEILVTDYNKIEFAYVPINNTFELEILRDKIEVGTSYLMSKKTSLTSENGVFYRITEKEIPEPVYVNVADFIKNCKKFPLRKHREKYSDYRKIHNQCTPSKSALKRIKKFLEKNKEDGDLIIFGGMSSPVRIDAAREFFFTYKDKYKM